jgi:hypothetical protein
VAHCSGVRALKCVWPNNGVVASYLEFATARKEWLRGEVPIAINAIGCGERDTRGDIR